jgi:hypothetical protein
MVEKMAASLVEKKEVLKVARMVVLTAVMLDLVREWQLALALAILELKI